MTDTEPTQLPPAANANPYPRDELTDIYAAAADQILKTSGITRGYCLVVGCQKGRLAYELAQRSQAADLRHRVGCRVGG